MKEACIPTHPGSRLRLQRGFTLVELITVILVLGVLAAVAIPRYTDLQGQARAAKVQAIAGAMKTSSALVKSAAMAQPVACSATAAASVVMEGATIDLNHCYPQALGAFDSGILAAANVPSTDSWALYGSAAGAAAGSTVVITLSDAPTPVDCSVSYTSAADAATPPALAASVNGC